MRRMTAFIPLVCFVTCVAPLRGANEPKIMRVNSDTALVHSGPGEKFYPTTRLSTGTEVDVYRRKANGWCAIRPPEGSFSYVRAEHVRQTDDSDIVEVFASATKTRVGSQLERVHHVEYVTLKPGERLQRLSGPLRLGSSGQIWYRVAPPAGEFRWIHEQNLTSEETMAVAPTGTARERALRLPEAVVPAPAPTPLAQHATESSADEADDDVTSTAPRTPAASSGSATASASATKATPNAATSGIALEKLTDAPADMVTEPIQPIQDKKLALASHQEPADAPVDTAAMANEQADSADDTGAWTAVESDPTADLVATPTSELYSGLSDLTVQLAELDLALSRMVTQEVDRWQLDELRQQAMQVAHLATEPEAYRDAQQLLARIEEFSTLQLRHQRLMTPSEADQAQTLSLPSAVTTRSTWGRSLANLVGLPPNPPGHFAAREAAIRRQAENVHYAGQGWLVPVVGSRADVPRFALTNEQGEILSFVSPRPGLNLRRYQRREVGIIGQETARTDDQTPHLLADRVIVLNRHGRY